MKCPVPLTFFNDWLEKYYLTETIRKDDGLDIVSLYAFTGRFFGKNLSIADFIVDMVLIALSKRYVLDIFCIRVKYENLKYQTRDITKAMKLKGMSDLPQSQTKKPFEIIFSDDVAIRGISLPDKEADSQQVLGIDNSLANFIIVWVDEAHELTENQVQLIKEGIRSKNPNCQVLFLYSSNGWSIEAYLMKLAQKLGVYIPSLLYKAPFYYYKWIKDLTGYSLFLLGNYRANNMLPMRQRYLLEMLEKTAPTRAKVVCYGEFGLHAGLVYEVDKIKRYCDFKPVFFSLGIDYGIDKDWTACVFELWDETRTKSFVTKEWGHSNKDMIFKDHQTQAKEINAWAIECMNFYKVRFIKPKVDNSAKGFIEWLNSEAIIKAINGRISYQKCVKRDIIERMNIKAFQISLGNFGIAMECVNTWREFVNCTYDPKKKTTEGYRYPLQINNHFRDAVDYGEEEYSNYMLRHPLYKTFTNIQTLSL